MRIGLLMLDTTRAFGQIYTIANPFQLTAFQGWADRADLPHKPVLEPFAGANSLIRHLESLGLCSSYEAFDIHPAAADVTFRDTFAAFPVGFEICITNPPWLAKNSARVRGLPFPDCAYDDLYKCALSHCLSHCGYVAAIIPEAFIRSGLFQDRLADFISIRSRLFLDTAHPTGLALFDPTPSEDIRLWADDRLIGHYHHLKARYLPPEIQEHVGFAKDNAIHFNDPNGKLGLIAFDNVREASIRFCHIDEIASYEIKQTSRFITRIGLDNPPPLAKLNSYLNQIRSTTQDVFLSSYRGLRKDGLYRRRLDWDLARRIIYHAQQTT